jgi:hypothetical protein
MGTHVEADDRDPDTVRFDLLVDQVNALVGKMDAVIDRGGNTQTVIHKTAGIGPWAAAAVTACFCTLFGLIFLAYDFGERAQAIGNDVRDLKAWQQIHEKRLNQLEHKP